MYLGSGKMDVVGRVSPYFSFETRWDKGRCCVSFPVVQSEQTSVTREVMGRHWACE